MNDTPEIILLDDDPRELDKISRLVSAYYAAKLPRSSVNLHPFRAGSAALEFFESGATVDIAFVDIIMPEMSGVQFAGKLREKEYKGYIVFFTTTNDFASESFMVGAFSYLLKPVQKGQLFGILKKIEEDCAKKHIEDSTAIFINTRQLSRNILLREIVCAEIMGRKLSFHLINNDIISFNMPLKEIAPQLLADGRFSHCHNSIIVNMDQVKNIMENGTVMKNGSVYPISRRFREFKSRYIAWALKSGGMI